MAGIYEWVEFDADKGDNWASQVHALSLWWIAAFSSSTPLQTEYL